MWVKGVRRSPLGTLCCVCSTLVPSRQLRSTLIPSTCLRISRCFPTRSTRCLTSWTTTGTCRFARRRTTADSCSEGKVIGLKRVDELLTPNVATGASSTSPEQSLLQRVVNSSAEAHERVRNVAALRNVMNQSPGNQPAGRSVTNQSANDFIAMIAVGDRQVDLATCISY